MGGDLDRFGRIAQMHRHRALEYEERLLLVAMDVTASFGAGLVAPQVRAGVLEPGFVGEPRGVPRRLSWLVRAGQPLAALQ